MIRLKKFNEVYYEIICSSEQLEALVKYFSYSVPGAEFSSAFRRGYWNGKKSLITKDGGLPAGLFDKFCDYCAARNIPLGVDRTPMPVYQLQDWLRAHPVYIGGVETTPYEHQIQAFNEAIKSGSKVIISPTSSGKSLVLYLLCRFLQENLDPKQKILLCVPNLTLLNQLYDNFDEFSSKDKEWSPVRNVHKIKAGVEKDAKKRIYLSTWQSLKDMEPEYFEKFGAVLIDETHLAKADSLYYIISQCVNARYRIGMTGTLDKIAANNLLIESMLGPAIQFITTKELMDLGLVAQMDINMLELIHKDELVQKCKRKEYVYEIEKVIMNDERNQFITTLCGRLSGNIMILFNYVDKHGIPLYDMIKDKFPEKKVYYISGKITDVERERIRKQMEKETNAILVANFATSGAGLSITQIDNLIIGSNIKSIIRTLQVVGRGLRIGKNKRTIKVYDIVDNLCYKKWENHLFRHGEERKKIYREQQFNFRVTKIQL